MAWKPTSWPELVLLTRLTTVPLRRLDLSSFIKLLALSLEGAGFVLSWLEAGYEMPSMLNILRLFASFFTGSFITPP